MNPISQVIPSEVKAKLSSQLSLAVGLAVDSFGDTSGDEDCITGALIGHMRHEARGHWSDQIHDYRWSTRGIKLRGRGNNAPEKRYGADLVVEISVVSNGRMLGQKVLLVQSKKEWSGTDQELREQCRKMTVVAGTSGSVAVDYRANGFVAVRSSDVLVAQGNRARILPEKFMSLGQCLGHEFFDCRIGSSEIYYDQALELIVNRSTDAILDAPHFFAWTKILRE